MTVDCIITGSRVVTPSGILDKNIIIDNGTITGITSESPAADTRINGDGLVSLPGLVDPHVHYGVYSPIAEAATTESHAAAIGGVTTMMRMLRLGGSYRRDLKAHLDASASSHYVDYAIHASIFNTSQIGEMQYCADAGVKSFKIYMNLGSDVGHVYMDMEPGATRLHDAHVEMTDDIVEGIVKKAAELGCPILVHAEDYESCACGMLTAQQENQDGLGAWSSSRSPEYEAKAIASISAHARRFDCTVYFVHIGSARALSQIRQEKNNGTRIHVESCPHYLTLSHDRQTGYLAKVMPPIRSRSDVDSVWSAISAGDIDCIGTDHVANQAELKLGGSDVWGALAGFPGIGTMLPILLSEGVRRGRISLEDVARLTGYTASRIFGMGHAKGALAPGLEADVTMVDMGLEKRVDSELFGGFSDYSVYDGWSLTGWPTKTLVRGKLVAEDFEVVGTPGYGRLVSRCAC